jgi:uracil-DNA glycosylase family 4
LAPSFDPATREALLARIRFYRDLGLTEFYRRPVDPALAEALAASSPGAPRLDSQTWESTPPPPPPPTTSPSATSEGAPSLRLHSGESLGHLDSQPAATRAPLQSQEPPIPPRKPFPPPPAQADAVPPADRAQFLTLIREDIGDCTRCQLSQGRNKIVFGDGSANARLMFVGEGPGADEDATGIPFVGKAGQLLNNMITAMGLKREEVYIANVVKCRPPGNRTPEPDEANTCSPFLFRQIDVIRPQVLVALGATAATYLLGSRQPLAGLRGRVHAFRGSQLIVTYHPAYLLRDPRQKKEAWADLQIAMRELGLRPPAKS